MRATKKETAEFLIRKELNNIRLQDFSIDDDGIRIEAWKTGTGSYPEQKQSSKPEVVTVMTESPKTPSPVPEFPAAQFPTIALVPLLVIVLFVLRQRFGRIHKTSPSRVSRSKIKAREDFSKIGP